MEERVIDPVCEMTIAREEAAATAKYEGQTYYFCAPGCKAKFEEDPEAYLDGGDQGPQSHSHEH